ncbi:MAG: hypothetical protein ABH986_04125, partial [archaeon]
IFILIYFSLVYSISSFNSKKDFTESELIEIENSSFKRNLIENTVDSVIKEEMEKEIMFGSDDPEKIREKVAAKLFEAFSGNELKSTEFKEITSGKKCAEIKIKGEKLSKEFIEKNSKVIVLNLKETLYLVKFVYTGGINKNQLIGAEIKENSTSQKFFIPVDYSITVISVRLVK